MSAELGLTVAAWALVGLGAGLAVPAAYLLVLTLASGVRPAPRGGRETRFVVVVPAHNEAGQIGRTVGSLRQIAYPPQNFAIWVVADNCTDTTQAEAEAAGATVLVRQDAERRGKGFALEHAFTRFVEEAGAHAVVVVDADTVVSPNVLSAFAARLEAGAQALQADYGVANPDGSWRTRLMAVALGMFHRLRSLGRQNLGLSCGLRGNGMGFSRALLEREPHRAHGLVEDVEYGIQIGQAGVPVVYVDEAKVLGDMVTSADASRSQRARWEGGRRALVRASLGPLMRAAWAKKSALLLDLAIDLVVPPLSYVALAAVGLAAGAMALEVAAHLLEASVPLAPAVHALAGGCLLALAAYVVRGTLLSSIGWGGFVALAWAPFYIVWKVALMARGGNKSQAWVRTQREKP